MTDYEQGRVLAYSGWTFEALIMAALRLASTSNHDTLAAAFPAIEKELKEAATKERNTK